MGWLCCLDGPQPLDTKTSTKHCPVFEVTVPWSLIAFFGGGVLCLSILESLPPFDFSGLLGAHAHHRKQGMNAPEGHVGQGRVGG